MNERPPEEIIKGLKTMYRDNFQTGLLTFVDWYKSALLMDKALQEAFVRKFDSLCV